MSIRRDLADRLAQLLDGDRFIVTARTAVPDQIAPGTIAVRVMPASVAPGPQIRSLVVTLTLWALSPKADPGDVDDDLDAALDDLLLAFLGVDFLGSIAAERGVMEDDAASYHGYRFTLTAYASITPEDTP